MTVNELILNLEKEMTSLEYSNNLYKESLNRVKDYLKEDSYSKEVLIGYISLIEEVQKNLICNNNKNPRV
jgi:hypothetical protein